MSNEEVLISLFVDSFQVKSEQVRELTYQSVNSWDSVGHMGLVASIEERFGIVLEADDIIDFSSFRVGVEILKKYGISF